MTSIVITSKIQAIKNLRTFCRERMAAAYQQGRVDMQNEIATGEKSRDFYPVPNLLDAKNFIEKELGVQIKLPTEIIDRMITDAQEELIKFEHEIKYRQERIYNLKRIRNASY